MTNTAYMTCRFCIATGRRGCLSCESAPKPAPSSPVGVPGLVLTVGTPEQDPDGWVIMRGVFGADALAAITDENGLDLRALDHGLQSAIALAAGRPAPAAPGPGMPIEEALDVSADEAEVGEVVDMVMLEIAHSPVIAVAGGSLRESVRSVRLDDGRYRIEHPSTPEPVSEVEAQRMRARWLVARDAFTRSTGRMVPRLPFDEVA